MPSTVPSQITLQALAGRIFDAAIDESRWSSLASEVACAFGSSSAAIGLQSAQSRFLFLDRTDNFEGSVVADYETHYWAQDVWTQAASRLEGSGASRVYISQELISDQDFERTEFYSDYCRRAGMYYVLGSMFEVAPDEVAVFGIHRLKGSGGFDLPHKAVAEALLPHMKSALLLRSQLRQVGDVVAFGLDVLESINTAAMVVDEDCRLVHANKLAAAMFGAMAPLRLAQGRVRLAATGLDRQFALRVRDAAAVAAGEPIAWDAVDVLRLPCQAGTAVIAHFAPLRYPGRQEVGPARLAVVILKDPSQGVPSLNALVEMFKLTPAEARVARGLCLGHSVEQVATQLGVAAATVRTHLKSIFGKTSTSKQHELVSQLLRSGG